MIDSMIDGVFFSLFFFVSAAGLGGFLIQRGQKGLFFLIFNLLLGYHYLYHGLYYSGLIRSVPYLFMTAQISAFFGMPVFHIYNCYIFKKDFILRRIHLLHFMAPVINTLYIFYYIFRSADEKIQMLAGQIPVRPPEAWPSEKYSQKIFAVYFLFYLGLMLFLAFKRIDIRFVLKNIRTGKFPKSFNLFSLIVYFLLFLVSAGWVFSPHERLLYRIFPMLIAVFLFSTYILLAVYPYFIQLGFLVEVEHTFTAKNYTKSRLSNVDLVELEKNLNHYMEKEKIYKDENLSLNAVASRLGLHPQQFSEYLNGIKNTTYSDFIRRWRINESIRLMSSGKTFNFTRIGYESGFNSVSSFYEAFKKETGVTPSAYRKKGRE